MSDMSNTHAELDRIDRETAEGTRGERDMSKCHQPYGSNKCGSTTINASGYCVRCGAKR